jgi:hypothetical protein
VNPSSLAIIEKFKQDRIAASTPTSLDTYLYIYNYARIECYISYMAGAKALARYLAPIDIKEIHATVPDMLVSYELTELAKVLQPHMLTHHNTIQIENAIYEYLTKSR